MTGRGRASERGRPAWPLVAGFFSLGWVVLYAGRAVLAPALGPLGWEWRIGPDGLGLVSSIFFLTYAAAQIPTGLLADRFGRGRLLLIGFLVFGLASILRGLSPTYGFFLIAGGAAGLGQGTYYATQFALSAEAIPPAHRALGSALIYSGMAVGTSMGFVLGSLTIHRLQWDWRVSFLLVGLAALILAAVFARSHLVGRRSGETSTTTAEAGPPIATAPASVPSRPLTAVLTRELGVAYGLNFTSLYAFFMLLTWLPYYLQYERGLSGTAAGFISSLVPWASIPSGLAVSLLSDRLGNRLKPLRLLLPAAAAAVVGLALAPSGWPLYGFLILYGLVGKSTTDPLLVARVIELAPPGRSATALGLLNFAGMLASVLAPAVTGLLIQATGSLRGGLILAAGILVVGFAVAAAAERDGEAGARRGGEGERAHT